jgi:hypothetical protein
MYTPLLWNRKFPPSIRHCTMPLASWIQYTRSKAIFLRIVSIASYNIRQGIPRYIVYSGFATAVMCASLNALMRSTRPTHLISLDFIFLTIMWWIVLIVSVLLLLPLSSVNGEELLAPRPIPKLEDHPFSAVFEYRLFLFKQYSILQRKFLKNKAANILPDSQTVQMAVFFVLYILVANVLSLNTKKLLAKFIIHCTMSKLIYICLITSCSIWQQITLFRKLYCWSLDRDVLLVPTRGVSWT